MNLDIWYQYLFILTCNFEYFYDIIKELILKYSVRLLKFIFDWRLFLSIIDKLIKMNDESKDANVFNSASDMMPGQDGGIMMPPVGGTMPGTIQAEDVIDDDHSSKSVATFIDEKVVIDPQDVPLSYPVAP